MTEIATIRIEGREFSAGGAHLPAGGSNEPLVGYVATAPQPDGRYVLQTWIGHGIALLKLESTWIYTMPSGARVRMYAWSCAYRGRRYYGRNAGPMLVVRMRPGRYVVPPVKAPAHRNAINPPPNPSEAR